MKVSVHGSSHAAMGIKNQDSCLELVSGDGKRKVKIVCDGCTNVDVKNPETFAKTHNEIGSGLFCLKYSLLENPFDFEKFEENANSIMQQMLDFAGFSLKNCNENMVECIVYNFCFTIFACFETEEYFFVYHLGDGVVIVQNKFGNISYLERKYVSSPPYLLNNFLMPENKIEFTKFTFDKKDAKNVGVASDGIMPMLGELAENEDKLKFDSLIGNVRNLPKINNEIAIRNFINSVKTICGDDSTLVI